MGDSAGASRTLRPRHPVGDGCTTDGKVYLDGKMVGTHKNTSLETVEINITDSGKPRVNGTSKATRVSKAGTIWEGVHTNEQGEELPIRLFLKKD